MEMHLEVKVVGKGAKGRTACGSSAYRACDKVIDNNGNVHDYRRKEGYISGGIELPAGAPEELRDRQTLWGRHEKKDIRKDAELFREVIAALPNELSVSAAERVARAMAAKVTEKGMCVQWDVHKSFSYEDRNGNRVGVKSRQKGVEYKKVENLHVHFMITMRELLPDGTFGNKNRSWNRYNGGLNLPGLLRPEAARLMNDELARMGSDKHVEHQSYADRGIDKIPGKHIGVAAMEMERKGIRTKQGDRERYVDWLNEIHASNLREYEQKTSHLDRLIAQAEATKEGSEAYKDWDALFALLRDIRRAKAALKSERSKLGNIISAYEEGNVDYLKWAGCDPDNAALRLALRETQEEQNTMILQLEAAEDLILDSKRLLKEHNRAYYNAKKADWEEYQIARKGHSLAYFQKRMKSLSGYMSHLRKSVSLLDALFNTQEYQDYLRKVEKLEETRGRIYSEYQRTKKEIQQHKVDLKQYKKEVKEAVRAKKKLEYDAR